MFIDILVVVVVVWGLVTGYRRGLLQSVFFLVGIGAGIIASLKFSAVTTAYLKELLDIDPSYLPLISFVIIFLITLGLVLMLANGLEAFLKATNLNFFNKAAGALVWTALGLFILSTVFWYLDQYQIIGQETQNASTTYTYVLPISPFVLEKAGMALPVLEDLYHQLEEQIHYQEPIIEINLPKSS